MDNTKQAAPAKGAVGILRECADIVGGARNTAHGEKERSFAAIAVSWNAYMSARKSGGPLSGRDVAQMMVLLKMIRSVQGSPVRDHFVDQAGYSAIAGELAEGEQPKAEPLNRDYGTPLTDAERDAVRDAANKLADASLLGSLYREGRPTYMHLGALAPGAYTRCRACGQTGPTCTMNVPCGRGRF